MCPWDDLLRHHPNHALLSEACDGLTIDLVPAYFRPDSPAHQLFDGMKQRNSSQAEIRSSYAEMFTSLGGVIWTFVGVVAAAAGPEVQFTAITRSATVNFKHENSATSNKYLLETMGGGVALLDYDNDGRLDIFFTNGRKIDDPMPDGKLPDKSDRRFWNRLYDQNTDGTFTDVREKAGLTGMAQNYYTMGVAVGDYDHDGFEDICVAGYGGNTLYHNNGDGTFTDVTKRAGVSAGGWSASAGFFDYDNYGDLDLFVTRYVDWSFRNNPYCGEQKPGLRAYCHPDNFRGATNIPITTTATEHLLTFPRRLASPTPKAKDWA